MATASTIIGQVRDLLRYHFSDSSRINNSLLSGFIYSYENPVLKIQSGAEEDYSNVSAFPAVYVSGSEIQSNNMNPLYGYTVEVDGEDAVSDNMVDMEAGAVRILCECEYKGQARALGYEIFNYIKKVSSVLADDFNLFYIYPQLSPQEPARSKTKTAYMMTINVQWYKFNAWSIS